MNINELQILFRALPAKKDQEGQKVILVHQARMVHQVQQVHQDHQAAMEYQG